MARQPVSKRVFLQQYVLNRALTVTNPLGRVLASEEAILAWEEIELACSKDLSSYHHMDKLLKK